jgi:branched-chain amino acid transport system permease protein
MVLIGGVATTYGAILAGILLTFVSELMAPLGPVRFMLVSVLIVLTMRFLPQGIWGLAQLRLGRAGVFTPMAGPEPRSKPANVSAGDRARLT